MERTWLPSPSCRRSWIPSGVRAFVGLRGVGWPVGSLRAARPAPSRRGLARALENRVSQKVRVRFAPSPTGYLHVGGARTALFNWIYARQTGGTFILRLEDTDEARNTDLARRTIYEGLRWLGLDPDEGPEQGGPCAPYAQSERQEIYRRHIEELIRSGAVYSCFCTRERLSQLRAEQEASKASIRYDQKCRGMSREEALALQKAGEIPTWRLKVPEGETVLDDLIRGRIVVQHADVEDIILVRADGTPIYNLAVVIDDYTMGVTHVLRGEDHLTNCFKQIILFKALGWPVPRYGHLPLILAPAGEGKLSKRKHPEAAIEHYIAKDYHREALINWLALLGWSFDDKTEIMTREEIVQRFSIERINKGGARLNLEKLAHLSGESIRRMPIEEFHAKILPHLQRAGFVGTPPSPSELALVLKLAPAERERLRAFSEIVESTRWVFAADIQPDEKAAKNLTKDPSIPGLLEAYAASLPDPLPEPALLEQQARAFATARSVGFGQLVHPIRAALTGRTTGPSLFDCVSVLGSERARQRLLQGAAFARQGQSSTA